MKCTTEDITAMLDLMRKLWPNTYDKHLNAETAKLWAHNFRPFPTDWVDEALRAQRDHSSAFPDYPDVRRRLKAMQQINEPHRELSSCPTITDEDQSRVAEWRERVAAILNDYTRDELMNMLGEIRAAVPTVAMMTSQSWRERKLSGYAKWALHEWITNGGQWPHRIVEVSGTWMAPPSEYYGDARGFE